MGAETYTAEGPHGQALKVIHHVEGYRGRGLSQVLLRGVLEDVRARHITVTNYCPVLDRFIEKNPGYAQLIDLGKPGSWPKGDRDAGPSDTAATRM